ncbi:MAG: hypothetical protein LBK73_00230, partial [Treponema sp.]|nr:hypothetical protein [Treponema sp.]
PAYSFYAFFCVKAYSPPPPPRGFELDSRFRFAKKYSLLLVRRLNAPPVLKRLFPLFISFTRRLSWQS